MIPMMIALALAEQRFFVQPLPHPALRHVETPAVVALVPYADTAPRARPAEALVGAGSISFGDALRRLELFYSLVPPIYWCHYVLFVFHICWGRF